MTQTGDGGESEGGESRPPAGGRPAHLITRDEARVWLAGSAVDRITTHHTDPLSARMIVEGGVDVARTRPDSRFGQGFYSTTRPDPQYGVARVRVAIRLLHPLILPDSILGTEMIYDLIAQTSADDARAAVLAANYDGVVLHLDPDEMWVVAYFNHQVKVIEGG